MVLYVLNVSVGAGVIAVLSSALPSDVRELFSVTEMSSGTRMLVGSKSIWASLRPSSPPVYSAALQGVHLGASGGRMRVSKRTFFCTGRHQFERMVVTWRVLQMGPMRPSHSRTWADMSDVPEISFGPLRIL